MDHRRRFLRHGLTLFVIGLATGLALPFFTNPRAGLAAHLEGLLNGMFLMIVGLAWNELQLTGRLARVAPPALLFGTYANWAATTASAAIGSSKATPLSGAGHAATPLVENLLYVGFATVALVMFAVCAVLARAAWRARDLTRGG